MRTAPAFKVKLYESFKRVSIKYYLRTAFFAAFLITVIDVNAARRRIMILAEVFVVSSVEALLAPSTAASLFVSLVAPRTAPSSAVAAIGTGVSAIVIAAGVNGAGVTSSPVVVSVFLTHSKLLSDTLYFLH